MVLVVGTGTAIFLGIVLGLRMKRGVAEGCYRTR
jgi:hypothetical protein